MCDWIHELSRVHHEHRHFNTLGSCDLDSCDLGSCDHGSCDLGSDPGTVSTDTANASDDGSASRYVHSVPSDTRSADDTTTTDHDTCVHVTSWEYSRDTPSYTSDAGSSNAGSRNAGHRNAGSKGMSARFRGCAVFIL